jgi:hypothetical protein
MREPDHINRIDLSPFLIHFCKSEKTFYDIIYSGHLMPNSSKWTFNHEVLCFTETPISCLVDFNTNELCKTKFWNGWKPHGFMIEKNVFHNKFEGLPVVYSPGSEIKKFNKIGEGWRLVSLNTTFQEEAESNIENRYSNYLWQREW